MRYGHRQPLNTIFCESNQLETGLDCRKAASKSPPNNQPAYLLVFPKNSSQPRNPPIAMIRQPIEWQSKNASNHTIIARQERNENSKLRDGKTNKTTATITRPISPQLPREQYSTTTRNNTFTARLAGHEIQRSYWDSVQNNHRSRSQLSSLPLLSLLRLYYDQQSFGKAGANTVCFDQGNRNAIADNTV